MLMKCRIGAVIAAGVVVIGFGAWSLATPKEPMGVVFSGVITKPAAITLFALAVTAGFVGYFLAWPYGREIGVLAVPAGLGVWAIRTENMRNLLLQNQSLEQRQEIFATFTWEPAFWLIIVIAGFAGIKIAEMISTQRKSNEHVEVENDFKGKKYINPVIAVVGSVLIARIFMGVLAQNFKLPDNILGSVVAQPATAQIAFAVVVSFGIAAFAVKTFLNANYIWSISAAAITTTLMSITCRKQDILQYLLNYHPAAFFPNVAAAILPLQMVAFGTLGAIAGYWVAIRYQYWRMHEI